MIYVVYYWNQRLERCVRVLRRGFACTTSELPREIATRCRARKLMGWELYSTTDAAETIVAAAKENGWKEECA